MTLFQLTTNNFFNINSLNFATKFFRILFFIFVAVLAVACGSHAIKPSVSEPDVTSPPLNYPDLTISEVKQALRKQYRAWKGTPYRLGGNNKTGIDCSGFVHVTFKNQLGINVPRTTAKLANTGQEIKRQQLTAGDLVFFHTGIAKRHVGIYVANGEFLHASTSNGVMMSNIYSPYWSKHYWKSKRVLIL